MSPENPFLLTASKKNHTYPVFVDCSRRICLFIISLCVYRYHLQKLFQMSYLIHPLRSVWIMDRYRFFFLLACAQFASRDRYHKCPIGLAISVFATRKTLEKHRKRPICMQRKRRPAHHRIQWAVRQVVPVGLHWFNNHRICVNSPVFHSSEHFCYFSL